MSVRANYPAPETKRRGRHLGNYDMKGGRTAHLV